VQLKYYVPFSAVKGFEAEQALKECLLPIEGTAIDESVNANKWQVTEEDLDYLAESLRTAQLRVNHAESALAVIGKVFNAQRIENIVKFQAEVGEENIIKKILRGYLTHVSIQVDSEQVVCSKCRKQTRKEGLLIHLCPGAWEIVKRPRVRELSIVATPAYETTTFTPAGFAAALNESLRDQKHPEFSQSFSEEVTDVGSSRVSTQEPEKQTVSEKEAKSPMSETKEASLKAQGVVNVAPSEQPPKELKYEDFLKQLEPLADQIRKLSEEVAALKRAMEAGEAGRKLAEEARKKAEEAKKKAEAEAEEAERGPLGRGPLEEEGEEESEESEEAEEAKAKGRGIVALEEIPAQRNVLGDVDWFKDLLKAHKKLVESFK